MSEYEAQAERFLKDYGFTIKAAWKDTACPKWESDTAYKHIHGDRYRVTIKRKADRKSISFDFWNSYNDAHEDKHPSDYEILACVSSEANSPTTPDEVAAELGDTMKPSQAITIAKWARRLQAFFTETELEALSEIR